MHEREREREREGGGRERISFDCVTKIKKSFLSQIFMYIKLPIPSHNVCEYRLHIDNTYVKRPLYSQLVCHRK